MFLLLLLSNRLTLIDSDMAKREFHIVRGNSQKPLFGVCNGCGQAFLAFGDIWGRIEDFLRRKFEEHACALKNDERIVARNKEAA
jgi:hypothetical protein